MQYVQCQPAAVRDDGVSEAVRAWLMDSEGDLARALSYGGEWEHGVHVRC